MRLIDADKLEPIEVGIDEMSFLAVDYEDIKNTPTIEPCEDAISREDAVKILWEWFPEYDEPMRKMKTLPSVAPSRPSGEWIPCSESLPSESGYYLVTLRDAFDEIELCIIWFAHEDDYSCGSEWREVTDSDTVIAWMPLPEPYKESE